MIKRALFIAVLVFATIAAKAQNVQETTIQVGDLSIPAYTVSLTQDEKRVNNTFKKQVKEWGVKTTTSKGYTMAVAEVISEISATPINFYSKVEEQGRRDNKTTVVTFAAVSTNLSTDQNAINAATKQILVKFAKRVINSEAEEQIASLEDKLAKVQKTAASAAAVVATIDKDNGKVESKIESKKKDIEKLQAKIDKLQKEIAAQEADIQNNATKKTEYSQKVDEAQQEIEKINAEIERNKSLLLQ